MSVASKCHGPGFRSPKEALCSPPEKLLYVTCIQLNAGQKHDYLAVVDVDPQSADFCQVVGRCETLHVGDELHHLGWNSCSSCFDQPNKRRNKLVAPCLKSDRVYIFDVSDQRRPKVSSTIEPAELHALDLSAPHTAHCLANGDVMLSCLGDARGQHRCAFVLVDGDSMKLKGLWSEANEGPRFGYDFWYQPRHDVMVSSEWGAPNAFRSGFRLEDLDKYGQRIHFWSWTKRKLLKSEDLGLDGQMPLEVRFLHDPDQAQGFVGCALGSSIFRFFKDDGCWRTQKVISVPPKRVSGWLLDSMPALITDILVSMDDRFLFFSCWAHGDVRMYDVSDPAKPKLVGQVFVAGSLCSDSKVQLVHDEELKERPTRAVVKGKPVFGSPQMLQLSLDGRRLYVTNSLFSAWDQQFYPELTEKGSTMLKLDVDTEKGGLSLDKDFLVDFGSEPFGPVLAHEMRFPGGDCTSDIFL